MQLPNRQAVVLFLAKPRLEGSFAVLRCRNRIGTVAYANAGTVVHGFVPFQER